MKNLILSMPLLAAIAACAPADQQTNTLAGAALGAAAGAAVSGDDDKVVGALPYHTLLASVGDHAPHLAS